MCRVPSAIQPVEQVTRLSLRTQLARTMGVHQWRIINHLRPMLLATTNTLSRGTQASLRVRIPVTHTLSTMMDLHAATGELITITAPVHLITMPPTLCNDNINSSNQCRVLCIRPCVTSQLRAQHKSPATQPIQAPNISQLQSRTTQRRKVTLQF